MSITRNRKENTILGHISDILDMSENGLTDEFMENAKPHIKSVSDFYSITPEQAVLFSHFIGQGEDDFITTEQLVKSLKCRPIDMLLYHNDIDGLIKRKLIVGREKKAEDHRSYRIPLPVIESVKSNAPLINREYKNINIYDLFDIFEELVEQCKDKEISSNFFINEVNALINDNLHLTFCQVFKSYRLKETNAGLLIFFCERLVNDGDDEIRLPQLEGLFETASECRRIGRTFRDRTNCLFSAGLIENTISEGLGDREGFRLTNKTKNELLVELNINLKNVKLKKDLILAENITEKKMFYNAKEEKSVLELTSLLMPETYKNTVERLKERGMRTGFACLFYGESGTGKTETVNMIAKNTGRDIMMVDISKTKSCWFGESEKKIKEVFDKYRAYVEACENAPILLLNEADAIIGKRKEVSAGNTAQTENAIQNIILQELENLNGILLATTNLTQNMDKAFERRFLYKIEFEKPAPAIRELLWKEMIPELSDSEARMLAEKFDFSGGQIENIARKRTVDFVISGGQYSIDKLIEYCRDERLEKVNKPIGFGKF